MQMTRKDEVKLRRKKNNKKQQKTKTQRGTWKGSLETSLIPPRPAPLISPMRRAAQGLPLLPCEHARLLAHKSRKE